MKVFDQQTIHKRLEELPEWYLDTDAIRRDWQFKDFLEAMSFLNDVANLAEKYQHHPEIHNVYNKVSLRFNTHDAGGITEKDFTIAKDINRL